MASIVGKKRGDRTYYYLVEPARVDGKPRIVSQRYLGTAADIEAGIGPGDGVYVALARVAREGVEVRDGVEKVCQVLRYKGFSH